MNTRRLADLEQDRRRKEMLKTAGILAGSWIVLVGIYYAVPAGYGTAPLSLLRLCSAIGVLTGVLVLMTQRIVRAELPELRAVEALGATLPLFLVLFARLYLSISHSSPTSFSRGLDHTSALYFTVTVFSTVGFGDITPKTDITEAIVSIQMLLDLALIGLVVRLIFNAARTTLANQQREDS